MIVLPTQDLTAQARVDTEPRGARMKARHLNRWVRETVHPELAKHSRRSGVQGPLRFSTKGTKARRFVTVRAAGERPLTDMPAPYDWVV